ncbi:MAG: hypothetical protein M3268_03075 [Acidobacteriota bacterium]|nr:hypothetical protein [Acidobacteriota bacterium]
MVRNVGRLARAALAPRAIIFGFATFMFGWALMSYWRAPEDSYYYNGGGLDDLIVASSLLIASAALSARSARGTLLAAVLSGPLPLIHVLIFVEGVGRRGPLLFSGAHLVAWLHRLSAIPPFVLVASAASFAVLVLALPSALRQLPQPAHAAGDEGRRRR